MKRIQPPWLLEGLAENQKADARRLHVEEMRAALGNGYSKTPTHSSWRSMINRCYRPYSNGYRNYGGRGISVCERWFRYDNFLSDMGQRPPGKQLDRVDTDGHYEPDNCQWLTPKDNSRKRRNSLPWLPGETEAQHRTRSHRAWRLDNFEARKAYKTKWNATPKQREKTKLRGKRYYEANQEQRKHYQRVRYLQNRERILLAEKERYRKLKESRQIIVT